MKSVNYHITWLWLIFLGHYVVECSLVMDLVNNLASSSAGCLVLVNELNAGADVWIDTNYVSTVSFAQFDTNAILPHLSNAGKYCMFNLLIFDSVDSSLQFFNR